MAEATPQTDLNEEGKRTLNYKPKGAAETSVTEQEADKLSPEAQKLAVWHEVQQKQKSRTTPDSIIMHPRIVSEQITKPVEPNLFDRTDLAGTAALQQAKMLNDEGNLLNALSFGIGGNALTLKVVKALQILLYKNSSLFGQQKTLSGASSVYALAKRTTKQTPNTPQGTPYPIITTTPYQFCKEVLGGKKPSKTEKEKILKELNRFERGKFIIQEGNHAACMSLVDVTYITDEKGNSVLWIELKPLFALIAGHGFVRERADILSLLSDVSKDMTLLLYELLITAFSRNFKGENTYNRKKDDVFEIIAKLRSYKTNPKRREADYQYSIGVMKRIRLLSDYNENGSTCTFTLNANHLNEDFNDEQEKPS